MENCIPEFWEREWEWKIAFPTFGNGNGNEKLIPKLWEREWEEGIPGNGREWEFPLTPDSHLPLKTVCFDLIGTKRCCMQNIAKLICLIGEYAGPNPKLK